MFLYLWKAKKLHNFFYRLVEKVHVKIYTKFTYQLIFEWIRICLRQMNQEIWISSAREIADQN